MSNLIVHGGTPLRGRVTPSANKNAVLPILCATLLTRAPLRLVGVPDITDVRKILEIFRTLGREVRWDHASATLELHHQATHFDAATHRLPEEMRSSIMLVPPLLARGMHLLLRLLLDIAAVALYVYLISVDLNGGDWYLGLAAPIILWGGAILLLLGLVLRVYRRSALTTLTILIGSIGVFVFGMEFFVDRWLHQLWSLSWSLVVLTICIGMVIPLIIIRRVPALREEARRRFHL